PHRTGKSALLRMQKRLASDEPFYRAGYGTWDEVAKTKNAIPLTRWSVLKAKKPDRGLLAFGVRFTPDGSTVALGGGVRPVDGPIHVEGFRQDNLGEGLQWLVDFLVERAGRTSMIVIDGRAGAGALAAALRKAG